MGLGLTGRFIVLIYSIVLNSTHIHSLGKSGKFQQLKANLREKYSNNQTSRVSLTFAH